MADKDDVFRDLRQKEFGRLGDKVYLDHTGSCLYTNSHIQKYYQKLTGNVFGNPHSRNACSERMSDIIYQTRLDILRRFNVTFDDYDIVFTSGATDALRIVGEYFKWTRDSIFAYTEDNHTSVIGIRELCCNKGASSYSFSCTRTKPLSECKLVKTGKESNISLDCAEECPASLFAFPAQSNFSGAKYPLTWIDDIKRKILPLDTLLQTRKEHTWYVICDAASFVSTSALDLKKHNADFVAISFYKIFGFPTGLGALLIKNGSDNALCNKKYFGGGSVSGWLSSQDFHSPKVVLHDRFEDGSSSFLSILALKLGFDTFSNLGLTINAIEQHTHSLWDRLYTILKSLKHENGKPVVEIYLNRDCVPKKRSSQGPILAFNVKRSDGSYIGYNHVLQLANSNNIYIRGGCFCNIGACISLIGSQNDILLRAYEDGHVCGDAVDLIDGKPIGALRLSLGPHSSESDIKLFVEFLKNCFQEQESHAAAKYCEVCLPTTRVLLENIVVYPVKSCQGMSVKEWDICETGLKFDRMWMVVNEYGSPITLKNTPHLVAIYPEVNILDRCLILRADGMDNINVPFIDESKVVQTESLRLNPECISKVCGDAVVGFDCGESASLWLSQVLGVACSLVQKSFNSQRYTKKRLNAQGSTNKITLVNEAQLLLVNRSSVEYLHAKIVEHGYLEKDEREAMIANISKRFRANLFVTGAPAFSEDYWSKITIDSRTNGCGDNEKIRLTKCGLCNRCNVICVDPDTGQKLNGPLRALANVSLGGNATRRKPTFGIYLRCENTSSTLRVQTEIEIIKGGMSQ